MRQQLVQEETVVLAVQQGSTLRVLLDQSVEDPMSLMHSRLTDRALQLQIARPNLEDVFIAATRGHRSGE